MKCAVVQIPGIMKALGVVSSGLNVPMQQTDLPVVNNAKQIVSMCHEIIQVTLRHVRSPPLASVQAADRHAIGLIDSPFIIISSLRSFTPSSSWCAWCPAAITRTEPKGEV